MHMGLVDDVKKVVDNLAAERGEFVLAMLYNVGGLDVSYGWSLIVSAPWTEWECSIPSI